MSNIKELMYKMQGSSIKEQHIKRIALFTLGESGRSRLGKDAIDAIIGYAEDYIRALIIEADTAAKHAKRSTIRKEDVRFVMERKE